MKILGVCPVFNEEDCIANAVRALLLACDDVHVFDHGSTDGTPQILAGFPSVNAIRVDREKVPARRPDNGVQNFELWHMIGRHILSLRDEFEWVMWLDADELLRQPSGELATKDAIVAEAERGVQVIRPLIRQFKMTKKDGSSGSYLDRMRRFVVRPEGHAPRAWQTRLTPPDLPAGAHVQDPSIKPKKWKFYKLWPAGTVVSNNEWMLDNYAFRSIAQAERKILAERDWLTPTEQRQRYYQYIRGDNRVRNVVTGGAGTTYQKEPLEMP